VARAVTGVDAAVASLVRGDAPAIYMLLDAEDRVAEANRHTRELVGPRLERARFGDLLVSFERDLSPAALARHGAPPRTVNLVTFTGLPLTCFCWFAPSDAGTVVVGGADPRDGELLRREMLLLNQALASRTRELHKANAELTRALAQRDQFLGMAAHDLRSPIQAILSLSGFLQEDLGEALTGEPRQFLDDIHASAELMHRVVDGFLDTALIGSGHFRLRREPASLHEVAALALRVVEPAARRKGVALVCGPDGGPGTLLLDRAKIQQVVVNLVSNALEHSHAGGEVTVEVGAEAGDGLLRVADRGTGIPPELRDCLFRAYTHAENKTAGERSSGLGLAITRLIVETHGGSIRVESEPGRGTTVAVRLPNAAA
jgi:signal transduction histidine kinase